jgi:hypothetical protein
MKLAFGSLTSAANDAANSPGPATETLATAGGWHRRAGRRILDQRGDRLAFVGSEGGDVDQSGHVRVRARLRDDGAAVRVADEKGLAGLSGDHPLGEGDVVGKRGRRVLDDGDVVAVLLQDVIDAFPAGAVDEAAVDEDDGECQFVHGELAFSAQGNRRGRML